MGTVSLLRRSTPLILLALLVGCQAQENVSVVISPESVEVGTFRKHHFTAIVSGSGDTGVIWGVQEGSEGGRITSDGVYTAPSTPGTYHVIATTRATPAKKASATVRVVEAPPEVTVAIDPAYQQVSAGGSVTFSAQVLGLTHPNLDTTVSWSVEEGEAGGSITAEGVYTAPRASGEYHVVATSNANPLRSATARVEVREITVEISAVEGQTGPLYVGGTRQFQASVTGTENQAVTWSVEGEDSGTVEPEGAFAVYTAPANPGTYTLVATSVEDPGSFGSIQIEVQTEPVVGVAIVDGPREVNTLETLQLEATVTNAQDESVTWSVKAGGVGGTIDATSGVYVAPANAGADTVVATSVEDPTKSAETVITVRPLLLEVTPETVTLLTGDTVEFTASVQNASNTGVTFALENDADAADGTLSTGSTPDRIVYTAPATAGSDTLRVTSKHDPNRYVVATITVNAPPPVSVSVSPSAKAILTGATVTLTATVTNDPSNAGVTWSITESDGGTITANGLSAQYTAPAVAGTYHVVARSVTDPSASATATITVQAVSYGVSISPVGPVSKVVGETEQFTAAISHTPNTGVSWSVAPGGAGGTIDATGLYTAPATVGSDTIIATSNDDPSETAQVTVNVTSNAVVDATPATHELVTGDSVTLTASVTGAITQTVTWSVPAGAGSLSATTGSSVVYTAPTAAGTYTVTVASDEDPSKTDTVNLTVHGVVTSGLHVHFKADQIGFPTGTAGEVAEWQDHSGNGYNVVQTQFMTARPLLIANAVNGRPALRFDGNNDRLENNAIPITGTTTTIFVVHNTDPTNGNVTLIDSPKKPDGSGGTVANTERNRIQITTAGPSTLAAQLYTTGFSTGNVHLPRGVFQSVTALFAGTNSRLRLNGNEATLSSKPAALGMRGVILGLKQDYSPNGTATLHSATEIAEVLVYDRGLNQAEIDQVEAYLRVKYALPAPTPPTP